MNKTLKRLAEPGVRMYLFFLMAFAVAALFFKLYMLAAVEGGIILLLVIYTIIIRKKRQKQLEAYIESIAYDTENAKNNTLMHFPLPIAVFRLDDSRIIWGNDFFFEMCGNTGKKLDARISDLVPAFTGKWLMEGKDRYPELLEVGDRVYLVKGNLVRSENEADAAFMGIAYWVDVTDYENIKAEYEATKPVVGIVIVDNLDEITKGLSNRLANDIQDSVEEILTAWVTGNRGIIRKFERDRYFVVFEHNAVDQMRESKFPILEKMHSMVNPSGANITISIGLGMNAGGLQESLNSAVGAAELALARGGDQAVIKNNLSYEFCGGRGLEVEKRTKVKSRVMATTLTGLIKESTSVMVMGHKYADLDTIGAAAAVCCLARKFGVQPYIVTDMENNVSRTLVEEMQLNSYYSRAFISPQEAIIRADGRTLLVVVDTNRPEQVESQDVLLTCNRVAVFDHHRVASTYIQNAAMSFIEPYASSVCELLTEILEETVEDDDIMKVEADAILSGIVLDTKNFTIRTGERTFETAAFLKRAGADTTDVKKLLQTDMTNTVARYTILQSARLYRNVAIAYRTDPQLRVVAAQAADELLNISGVEASVVVAPDGNGNSFASARSIGDMSVQLVMEKVGGGGNRSVAAAQFPDTPADVALKRVLAAIDEYLEEKS